MSSSLQGLLSPRLLTGEPVSLTDNRKDAVQPDPPLILHQDGQTWVLHTSATIRQNLENTEEPTLTEDPLQSSIKVLSESVLDLESNERTTVCEVSRIGILSKSFFGQSR